MFIKYLISSIESLYMQMIHTNYINNNTGLKKIRLGSLPGIHRAANNSQCAALDTVIGKCQGNRRKPDWEGKKSCKKSWSSCWLSIRQGREQARIP